MDKDTREEGGQAGDAAPFPDEPRSEGGPVTRDPTAPVRENRGYSSGKPAEEQPPLERADEHEAAPQPDTAGQPVVPEPASKEAIEPGEAIVTPPAEPAPEPVVDPTVPDNVEATVENEAATGDEWRGAIADALVEPSVLEPDASPPDEPSAPDPPAEPVGHPAAQTRLVGSFDPASDTGAREDAAPAPSEPAAEAAADDAADASFTSAARDLFNPPETQEEPHLVTLGRRLNPALRVPRADLPEIAPAAEPATRPARRWMDYLRTGVRYGLYAVAGYFALVLVLIVLFRFVNPPGSMLMLTQFLGGTSIDRTWVPLSAISPHLVRAVIVSEDGRFCEHSGIDTAAIKEAIDRAARGTPRGASTISMQVTKNLYLWNAKSYVRKVIEIPLTLVMELVWPKWRVLEVYLNTAEWAPGVFGAEAAARHHFGKPAARLSERESSLLAAVLPNPVVRNAGSPGPQTSAKARVVQARVRAYGAVATCVTAAAAPAPAPASAVPALVKTPARKTPSQKAAQPRKKPQQQQQKSEDWEPMINFGPR